MIIFVLLLLTEAALSVYRIKTQSMQHKLTAILRSASVLVLAVLAYMSVITWGFRYYALAAVLVISAAANIVQILRKKAAADLQSVCILRKSIGMSVLLFAALLPAIVFSEYRPLPVTGKYRVETATEHFIDESRIDACDGRGGARKLAAEFWYPADAEESFPLIVFSHGAFGTRTSNETLFRELASHGYVVCSIDHTYQCLYTMDESGKVLMMSSKYFDEIRRENAKEDKSGSLELYKKWMGVRLADIDFIIETIKNSPADTLYGRINTEETGVMGHSLGGSAALGTGRKSSDINAVVALESPFMCDILGVENDEFVFESAEYPVPVLNVYSDSSWPHLAEWPQYGENVRLLSSPGKDAYNLHLEGAGHLSLTDLSLASPVLTRLLNGHAASVAAEDCLLRINKECLEFFDCYLKGAGEYGS